MLNSTQSSMPPSPISPLVCLFLQPAIQESISVFMARVHASVNKAREKYQPNEKRYNYTTSRAFSSKSKCTITFWRGVPCSFKERWTDLVTALKNQVNVFKMCLMAGNEREGWTTKTSSLTETVRQRRGRAIGYSFSWMNTSDNSWCKQYGGVFFLRVLSSKNKI